MRNKVCSTFIDVCRVLISSARGIDAEECWGEITNALREVPLESGAGKKFIEAYLMGQVIRE